MINIIFYKYVIDVDPIELLHEYSYSYFELPNENCETNTILNTIQCASRNKIS